MKRNPALATLLVVAALGPRLAAAQALPAGPYSAFDGRLAVGAELVATIGERDDDAFFNYTDYEHNVLRMFRLALAADWRPLERFAVVAEVRSEDLEAVRPYALYVRVRPWADRPFDIQAGRIPPAFGTFGRQTYATANLLAGYPLAYQYLTSLRAEAIPRTVEDLLQMRGRGWRAAYPIGVPHAGPGLPLVSGFRWDTGVQARWRGRMFDATAALTAGTLSDPQVGDNNDGRQLSGRLAAMPAPGLIIGSSAARGEWLDEDVVARLPAGTAATYRQAAVGADLEYSRDHWIVRSEAIWSRWEMPFAGTATTSNLDAWALWIEGRYRLTPRLFVAGRADRLSFSKVASGERRLTWDAPITRLEANVGLYLQRNLVARAVLQHNDRDGGRVQRRTFVSGQLAYWF